MRNVVLQHKHTSRRSWLEQRKDAEAVFVAGRRQWTGKHISILRVCFHNILLELCFCCVFISVGFSVWWGSKWRILNSKLSLKLKRTQRERVVDCKLVLCLLLAQSLRPIRRLKDGINLLYSCMACVGMIKFESSETWVWRATARRPCVGTVDVTLELVDSGFRFEMTKAYLEWEEREIWLVKSLWMEPTTESFALLM